MNKTVSIMHISDLHRSRDSHVSNSSLLSSLLNDIERYSSETPKIIIPNVIIVSGDIIRGSVSKDNSEIEIQDQYNEASKFLNNLVTEVLEEDKERIIIVPGNHDIDWYTSKQSMNLIVDDQIKDSEGRLKSGVFEDTINTHSDMRWSWSDLKFYKVVNKVLYEKRLKYFIDFYNSFYENKRTYSLVTAEQFDVFDMPELGISVVGFNSCYNSDHLNKAGAIHPDCIAESNIAMKKLKRKGRLLLAVWHHNTKGMPYSNDYIDSSFLKNLIDSDIKLGFHGHQHKTEIIHEENNVFEQKNITVFSSGTLCGGPKELPTGYNRQYNIINILNNDKDNKVLDVVLHSREKTAASSFDNPVWGKGNIDSGNSNFELTVTKELVTFNNDSELASAELFVSNKMYDSAIMILQKLDKEDSFVRKFLLICYSEKDDFNSILDEFDDPINNEEAIHVLNAAIQLNNKKKMKILLSSSLISASRDPSVTHIKQKIETLLK